MVSKAYSLSTLIFLAVLVVLVVGTQGTAMSVIVDDADPRILYSSNGWATQTTCPSCFPQLDKSQVLGGTWHFSNNTANSGFTFFFIGTSVELRYIASDTVQMLAERVSYIIDGIQYGIAAQFQHLDAISFAYNQQLFSVTGLPNTQHTLQVNIVDASSVMFDYLKYEEADVVTSSTTNIASPDPNPNPSSNPSPNSSPATNPSSSSSPTSTNSSTTTNTNSTPTSNIGKNTTNTSMSLSLLLATNSNSDSNATPTSDASSTNPDVSPTNSGSSSNVNLGAVIGGVTSGLALLVLIIFLRWVLKHRRGKHLEQTSAPYVDSTSLLVTTPARKFAGPPGNYSLNPVANQVLPPLPDHPVEAGLMSRSRYTSYQSEASRGTPASSY